MLSPSIFNFGSQRIWPQPTPPRYKEAGALGGGGGFWGGVGCPPPPPLLNEIGAGLVHAAGKGMGRSILPSGSLIFGQCLGNMTRCMEKQKPWVTTAACGASLHCASRCQLLHVATYGGEGGGGMEKWALVPGLYIRYRKWAAKRPGRNFIHMQLNLISTLWGSLSLIYVGVPRNPPPPCTPDLSVAGKGVLRGSGNGLSLPPPPPSHWSNFLPTP